MEKIIDHFNKIDNNTWNIFKNSNYDRKSMQELANTHSLRNEIISLMSEHGLENDSYVEMLDYTIDLFDSQGLGVDYYGYHNINHELEVTYVSLLALNQKKIKFTQEDKKSIFAAALFHDFDPQKSVDKPHEESVLKFISNFIIFKFRTIIINTRE